MLKINKKVEYALMALKIIALKKEGELTSAREVCDNIGTPFDTTAKVMQIMNQNGVLKSIKGVKGGYSLTKSVEEISYKELVEMIEGKKYESVCQTNKGVCDLFKNCNIKSPMDSLNIKVNNFLAGLTLAELLFGSGPLDLIMKENLEDKHVN